MKKIVIALAVATVGVAQYYSFGKEKPTASIDMEIVAQPSYFGEEVKVASKLYKYVKARDIASLATLFEYPISRKYPIRDILNEKEFIERYKEIFDDQFCDQIINDPNDWSMRAWRGYAYNGGDLWVESSNGKITSVNVYSDLSQEIFQNLALEEWLTLHNSISKNAIYPICSFKTENGEWYGRIDYISSPADNREIQLSLYKSTTSIDCAPDYLVFGFISMQGNAGNLYYCFESESYNFQVDNPVIYEGGKCPNILTIEKLIGQKTEESFAIDWVYWEDLRKEYL